MLSVVHSSVYCGICGAVNDAVYLVFGHKLIHSRLHCYVELFHVGIEESVLRIAFLQQLNLVSQLPVAACDKYVHA